MSIQYDEKTRLFHLSTISTSYVFQVFQKGYLMHLYWGERIRNPKAEHLRFVGKKPWTTCPDSEDKTFSLDIIPQEYPAYGNTDLRSPAYQVQLENGSTITDLRYKSHEIISGKSALEGLPATYTEKDDKVETLEIVLQDDLIGLEVILSYSVFEELDAITRSVRFVNSGSSSLRLLSALSMNVDFDHSDFEMLQLSGAWARERHVCRRPIVPGHQMISSARGGSSHQQNPFVALLEKDADEHHGHVFGFSLVYSGNFEADVEVDQFGGTRVSMGINPFDFSWLLESKEEFQTPEVVMVHSTSGLSGMSAIYHKLYRERLCRGSHRDQLRPVQINNWEATYFDFDEEKILSIASSASELGIDLLVLDDGWFGKRNIDNCSLGDWYVNKEKLPCGLDGLAKGVNDKGLDFGLWFEPEMVSPDSDLYRAHPDWCLHVPNRSRSEERHQLILDMSRKEVQDDIIMKLSDILSSVPVTFVKWDMNRHMSEVGSRSLPAERQRETAHRYILGLYRVMEILTKRFPHILFESCAGGGGRFDPGMLYYMPQTWTSDDTDAIARLKIQYGTSMVYPASAMGSHVSAVPNHQVHRTTSLKTRYDVASTGAFGYQLDITQMTEDEMATVKKQIIDYKKVQPIIHFGRHYRLMNPFTDNQSAWMYVTEDKKEAYVVYCYMLAEPNQWIKHLKLQGLDPECDYDLVGTNEVYGGDELLRAGLCITDVHGDFESRVWHLKARPSI